MDNVSSGLSKTSQNERRSSQHQQNLPPALNPLSSAVRGRGEREIVTRASSEN